MIASCNLFFPDLENLVLVSNTERISFGDILPSSLWN
ncbi:hypothetical protein BMETH_290_0 [methanotrophic bacterial endosymbiont of Bathymodiolus sp.]|nr:hypothetical protein BMETH_290_0 [methanotrophic bacterial endosymbiont of Bathymodiolus sp.]